MRTYGIDVKEAAKILESLEIIHPYGVVGNLPWQGGSKIVEFGEDEALQNLVVLADGIRTFTEQEENIELQNSIRSVVDQSRLILFLGFAFHDQNIELLRLGTSGEFRRIYGTAWMMSPDNRDVTRNKLAHAFCGGERDQVVLSANGCKELFTEYSKSLNSA